LFCLFSTDVTTCDLNRTLSSTQILLWPVKLLSINGSVQNYVYGAWVLAATCWHLRSQPGLILISRSLAMKFWNKRIRHTRIREGGE